MHKDPIVRKAYRHQKYLDNKEKEIDNVYRWREENRDKWLEQKRAQNKRYRKRQKWKKSLGLMK